MTETKVAPERLIICTDGHKPAIADWAKDKMKGCDVEYVRKDIAFKAAAATVRGLPDHTVTCGVWLEHVCTCSFRKEAIDALERTEYARVDPPAAPTVLLDPAGLAEAFEENDRYQALLLKWFVKPADPRGYLIYEGAFEGDEQAAIAYQHAWSIAESIAEKHNARLATPIFAPPAPDEATRGNDNQ